MPGTDDITPEFSRTVDLDDLGEEEMQIDIRASEHECRALAERFGLPAVGALSATVRLKRLAAGRVRLRAAFRAEVTQTCVVTLEPIDAVVEDNVDIQFEPPSAGAAALEAAYDPSADREPLPGDSLDVGEIIAEELALSLDPYPRKPGVSVDMGRGEAGAEEGGPSKEGPFEALAALKRKE